MCLGMRKEESDYDTDWSIYDVSNTQVALKHITLTADLSPPKKRTYADSLLLLLLWNASRKKEKMSKTLRALAHSKHKVADEILSKFPINSPPSSNCASERKVKADPNLQPPTRPRDVCQKIREDGERERGIGKVGCCPSPMQLCLNAPDNANFSTGWILYVPCMVRYIIYEHARVYRYLSHWS